MLLPRCFAVLLPVLGIVLSATPAHEGASSADLERNRRLLDRWKADPEHYDRLQQDLRAFWAMPEERRRRIRTLDRDLHQADSGTQKRLWRAAERYSFWLERLPAEDRQKIEAADGPEERLRRIRDLRERQAIERLPKRVGEELLGLPAAERTARLAQVREQERQQRKLWQRPLGAGPRPGKTPATLRDLPPAAQTFLERHILPRLSDDEKARLREAEGRPEFVQVVKHLAEQHPVLPPLPAPHKPVRRFEDLPERAKVEAGSKPSWERRTQAWGKLQKVEGMWPEWALAFHAELTAEQRKNMPPLGASRPADFPPEVQTFLEQTLKPKLSARERVNLRDAEGHWPEYPKRLLDLSHKHKLEVPGMSLPAIPD